jgi:ketosteroid isomerase-like protein
MSSLREMVERTIKIVEKMDVDAVMALFAEDALFIDPHYPKPSMQGKAAIREGLVWGFGSMRKMGFPITAYYESPDGKSAVVEVATSHVLKQGMQLNFPQVFVIDTRDGLVTRLQAYEPYGPHGIVGVAQIMTRFVRKLQGKR